MRLFAYYAFHTVINTIKKLFKTWIAIMAACLVLGGIVGIIAGKVIPQVTKAQVGEQITSEQTSETEEVQDKEEEGKKLPDFMVSRGLTRDDMVDVIVGAVFLLLIMINIATVKKSGQMFKPADVPILFASPMKPQSVLMFRLLCTLGLNIVLGLYMIAQIPNWIHNLGLPVWGAWSILVGYIVALLFGTLLQVAIYTLTCNSKKGVVNIATVLLVFFAVLAAAFIAYTAITKQDIISAVFNFFGNKKTFWIPFYGWTRGLIYYAVTGEVAKSLIYLAVNVLSCVLMIILIWNVKADFYEDAMFASEKVAAKMENAKNASKGGVGTREKNRSDKLKRDGFAKGWGASVYFHKAVYNRLRFAPGQIFSKTFIIASVISGFCAWLGTKLPEMKMGTYWLPASALCLVTFYRAMGNPVEEDTSREFFILIPESPFKKIWASLLGCLAVCAIDLAVPALIPRLMDRFFFNGALNTNMISVLVWFLFILSISLFATTVGTFINLSVPGETGATIKTMIQMMFIYFGILPEVGIVIAGALFGHMELALLVGVVFNIGFGFLFAGLSTKFLGNR